MYNESRILSLPMTEAYFRLILRRFGADRASRAALLAGTDYADDRAGGSSDVAPILTFPRVRGKGARFRCGGRSGN